MTTIIGTIANVQEIVTDPNIKAAKKYRIKPGTTYTGNLTNPNWLTDGTRLQKVDENGTFKDIQWVIIAEKNYGTILISLPSPMYSTQYVVLVKTEDIQEIFPTEILVPAKTSFPWTVTVAPIAFEKEKDAIRLYQTILKALNDSLGSSGQEYKHKLSVFKEYDVDTVQL